MTFSWFVVAKRQAELITLNSQGKIFDDAIDALYLSVQDRPPGCSAMWLKA